MEILFLLIVLVVLFLAVFSSRKEQASAADNIKDAVQKEKQGFAEEDIMTYGQVQQRREELINVLDENLSDNLCAVTKSKTKANGIQVAEANKQLINNNIFDKGNFFKIHCLFFIIISNHFFKINLRHINTYTS